MLFKSLKVGVYIWWFLKSVQIELFILNWNDLSTSMLHGMWEKYLDKEFWFFYSNLMKELDLLRLGDFLWLFVSSALFALIWNVLFVKTLCKLTKGKILLLELVFYCFLCACCWWPQLSLRRVPFDLTNHREIFDLFLHPDVNSQNLAALLLDRPFYMEGST